jgi:hypothetical protein
MPFKKNSFFFDNITDMLVHIHGCPGMEVATSLECIQHAFTISKMGQDPQLQLHSNMPLMSECVCVRETRTEKAQIIEGPKIVYRGNR